MSNAFTQVIDRVKNEPKIGLYATCSLVTLIWLLTRLPTFFRKSIPSRPATPDLEKPAARSFKALPREPGGKHHIQNSLV